MTTNADELTGRRAEPLAAHDICDRNDIDALLRRFYGRVLFDEMLAEPFRDIRVLGLESHLPVMCDFWETVLFGTKSYRNSVFRVHQKVDHRTPLSEKHFLRWLTMWITAVDELYAGPAAERAKVQAGRIAYAMKRRLGGEAGAAPLGAFADFVARATAADSH